MLWFGIGLWMYYVQNVSFTIHIVILFFQMLNDFNDKDKIHSSTQKYIQEMIQIRNHFFIEVLWCFLLKHGEVVIDVLLFWVVNFSEWLQNDYVSFLLCSDLFECSFSNDIIFLEYLKYKIIKHSFMSLLQSTKPY